MRILLGDNPFTGVNHLSQENTRHKGLRSDPARIAEVINAALASGAEGFVCSAHPNNWKVLRTMRSSDYRRSFGVYLVVPDAYSYVRLASEKGIVGLLRESIGKTSLRGKASAALGGAMVALSSDPKRLIETYLQMEVARFSQALPKTVNLRGVFLHEILTDLIIAFELNEFANQFVQYARSSLHVTPGFVTRNFSRFIDFALRNQIQLADLRIMTPFNKVGFQMNPSRRACELALTKAPDNTVIAMSVLASGYLEIKDAVEYIMSLERRVSCVVGVSTTEHARETFEYLCSALTEKS